MATVTVNDSPAVNSGGVQNNDKTVLTDSKGRKITLRELDPLQESRIFMAVGPENSGNSAYMSGYAFPAAMVEYVDSDFYSIPANLKQIEGRLVVLGREGMLAIREYMLKALRDAEDGGENAVNDATEEAAKN